MRLQRYIFWQVLRSFLLLLLVVTGVVFLAGMMQALARYQDLSISLVLSRVPFLLPTALGLSIPLALLVGTLLTYGRLSADNEILALKMAGVHPHHAVAPALALGLFLSLLALFVNGTLAPLASVRARAVTTDDFRKLLDSLEERRADSFRGEGVSMYWDGVDDEGWLKNFGFELPATESEMTEGEATRARIMKDTAGEALIFDLRDVTIFSGGGLDETHVDRKELVYPIGSLFGTEVEMERKELLTSRELRYRFLRDPGLGRASDSGSLNSYRIEYSSRIALALSCLVFVLVGAPLGILFRRGSFVGATFVALVLAFVVYYPLHEIGKSLAKHGSLSAPLALALPGLALGALGLFLLSRVPRH